MTLTQYPVRIEPLGLDLICQESETIIQCAWRNGLYWPTICGGVAECGACRCEVIEGHDALGDASRSEEIMMKMRPALFAKGIVRLACCLTISGPVTLRKEGVRRR